MLIVFHVNKLFFFSTTTTLSTRKKKQIISVKEKSVFLTSIVFHMKLQKNEKLKATTKLKILLIHYKEMINSCFKYEAFP